MTAPFRDEAQRAEVCRALLATGDLQRFWTSRGPTAEVQSIITATAETTPSVTPSLDRGDRALLFAAWAIWSGEPTDLRYDELVGLPEAEPIAKLTVAMLYGPRAIDEWLTRSDSTETFARTVADVHGAAADLFDQARAAFAEGRRGPMNFAAAPDACAIGALRMAQYLLMDGAKKIRSNKKREKEAQRLMLHVLGLFAAMERERADVALREGTPRPRMQEDDVLDADGEDDG